MCRASSPCQERNNAGQLPPWVTSDHTPLLEPAEFVVSESSACVNATRNTWAMCSAHMCACDALIMQEAPVTIARPRASRTGG